MAKNQEIVEVGDTNHNLNSIASLTNPTSEARSSQFCSNPNGFPNFTPPPLLIASFGIPYSSTRIDRMLQSWSAFVTDVEFEIEASRVHWSELQSSTVVHQTRPTEQALVDAKTHLTNVEILQHLRNQWPETRPSFFQDWSDHLEVGAKIAEGVQAEIFEARLATPRSFCARCFGCWRIHSVFTNGGYPCVLKVFKEGATIHELQRQWPPGMMKQSNKLFLKDRVLYVSRIWGGVLLANGRFAFRMWKYWGDLRKLIDLAMQCNGNRSSPFSPLELVRNMRQIASGMKRLSKCNIVHRDHKASNVLINPMFQSRFDPTLLYHDRYGWYHCMVADFECSVGIVGTGFWRAPEILQAVKDCNITPDLFTEASDVYSFAMTCYEMITCQLPFEDVRLTNYDVVLEGGRPILPNDVKPWIRKLLNRCWHSNPLERPSFKEIWVIIAKHYCWSKYFKRDTRSTIFGCFRFYYL